MPLLASENSKPVNQFAEAEKTQSYDKVVDVAQAIITKHSVAEQKAKHHKKHVHSKSHRIDQLSMNVESL